MQPPPFYMPPGKTKNRFLAALCHTDRYAGRFMLRLPKDTGIQGRRLRHILHGGREPEYLEVLRLTDAISKASGFTVPPEELIIAREDSFPTEFICDLYQCRCLPPWAWDEEGRRKPEFEGVPPGKWTFEVPQPPHQPTSLPNHFP